MAGSRSRLPLVVAVVLGIALVLLVRVYVGGKGPAKASRPAAGSTSGGGSADPRCTNLAVTASSEKAALLSRIAEDYDRAGRTVGGRCARVVVTSKASGAAESALARGWDEQRDGLRPDVWTPASTGWVQLLRDALARADRPGLAPADLPSIAKTPLVLAMPEPMARALGWPGRQPGWSDLLDLSRDPRGWGRFGHSEWGSFRLGKTNPTLSTSGLNATVGAYIAATGRSSDLTARDLRNPKVVAYVRGVEAAVVHYGDTTLTFLGNLQKADDAGQGLTYISAVAVEEKSVFDYNQGNPSGDPATLGRHAKPSVRLVGVYPREGTLFSDNPYAVLTAPWVDDARRAVAADFLGYVRGGGAQDRFRAAGFRDFTGKPGDAVSEANGLLPAQPTITLAPPAPAVLAGVEQSWTQLRKRARVLLVLDVSGSMGEPVGGTGSTKLQLAQRAAVNALGDFAPDDQVGVWAFTTEAQGDGTTALYREVAPIAPVGPALPRLRAGISALVPLNGTPLYAITRQAGQAVRRGFDPTRINAVVLLTDGRNEYPPDTDLDGLVRDLTAAGESGGVRVFSIGYGADADLGALRRISEASRAAAYDASDPASIDKVFAAVVSNF